MESTTLESCDAFVSLSRSVRRTRAIKALCILTKFLRISGRDEIDQLWKN
jgi:hypothetical protein